MRQIDFNSLFFDDSIGKNVDASQVTRMADYFMQLKQFDKAVDLLAAIDRVRLDIDVRHNHLMILICFLFGRSMMLQN